MRVSITSRRSASPQAVRRCGLAAAALLVLILGTQGTQDAVANGDTRTLSLYHNHTRESVTVTFRRNGRYDPRALEQLNWFLRDWRRDEPTRMDPRLFDTLWEVHRLSGSGSAIHVNSAYRSPATNSMLRRRSSGVAQNSQHMRGKAIDFYLPDVSIDRIRAIGMRLQDGGVGYYPSAYTPFVHLDVGSVRSWPRMTRDQLVRLFPDGKTVHIPADGHPLPRYEEARAEVLAKGGTVAGYSMVADAGEAAQPRRRGFWATLFGWNDDDEDAEEIRARPSRNLFAARRAPPPQPVLDDEGEAPARRAQVARAEPPRPATRIAGSPRTVETPVGPRLDWQQGPTQMAVGSGGLAALAYAPMPPRRPDDVTMTGSLPSVPLPPTRPVSVALAAAAPLPAEPPSATLPEAGAPAHPLPPARPAAVMAAAGPQPAPSAAPGRPAAAIMAAAGVQPAPSAPAAPSAPPAPAPEAPKVAAAAPSAGTKPQPRGGAAEAAARSAEPARKGASDTLLAMSFSASPMGDLTTGRFTGPAVKPLPLVR